MGRVWEGGVTVWRGEYEGCVESMGGRGDSVEGESSEGGTQRTKRNMRVIT